jgi:hypothetical protein
MWPTPGRQSTLDTLIQDSPGSQLISYVFESKELCFQLFHPTLGFIHIRVVSDTVHGRSVPSDPKRAICRVELIELSRHLKVSNTRYVAPVDDRLLDQQARSRIHLAYGRRASEHPYLLLLKGEYPLLACLVKDRSEIVWTND